MKEVDLDKILTAKQQQCWEAVSSLTQYEEVVFGGAAGGGKSFVGCTWQIARRLKYPGTRGMIGRSVLKTLKETTGKTFFEVASSIFGMVEGVHYTYNQTEGLIKWFNGSETYFKDLYLKPSDPNIDALGSTEYTDAFVDEAAQIAFSVYEVITSRLRFKTKEYGIKGVLLMTCNPTKGWLYNEFYKPHVDGRLSQHRCFIQSLHSDNPHLDEQYVRKLSRLSEANRKRLMDGDWDYDSSIDRLFDYDDLISSFRDEITGNGKKYISADVARFGKDKTVIGVWDGLSLIEIKELAQSSVPDTVKLIRSLMSDHSVELRNVVVDEDGIGGGVVDMLKSRGFRGGSVPIRSKDYTNLRTQCYFKLAEFMEKNQVTIPFDKFKEEIIKELDLTRRKDVDKDGKLQIVSKDVIKQKLGYSPDYADMVMMRMYFELYKNYGVYTVG